MFYFLFITALAFELKKEIANNAVMMILSVVFKVMITIVMVFLITMMVMMKVYIRM